MKKNLRKQNYINVTKVVRKMMAKNLSENGVFEEKSHRFAVVYDKRMSISEQNVQLIRKIFYHCVYITSILFLREGEVPTRKKFISVKI